MVIGGKNTLAMLNDVGISPEMLLMAAGGAAVGGMALKLALGGGMAGAAGMAFGDDGGDPNEFVVNTQRNSPWVGNRQEKDRDGATLGRLIVEGLQNAIVPWLEAQFSELVNLNAKTGEVAENTKDNMVPTDG